MRSVRLGNPVCPSAFVIGQPGRGNVFDVFTFDVDRKNQTGLFVIRQTEVLDQLDNLLVVATKTKLRSLAGRPFLVDTGDSQLDTDLSGLRRVLSGYREEMLYPVSWKAE